MRIGSPSHPGTPGGAAGEKTPQSADLVGVLDHEIGEAFDFARSLQPAYSFFGGARIADSDPFFSQGKVWGEAVLLANAGARDPAALIKAAASGQFAPEAIAAAKAVVLGASVGLTEPHDGAPVFLDAASRRAMKARTRTGAGPGMMEAVPVGYLDALAKLKTVMAGSKFVATGLQTQGSRIALPFEQKENDFIDEVQEFAHFLPRRLALTERAAGFVVFPGGYGTLNELFEVLRADRPTLLYGESFWKDILHSVEDAWLARDLVDPALLKNIALADDVESGLIKLAGQVDRAKAPEAPTAARAKQMTTDIREGLEALANMPSAVTFIGGRRLSAEDHEVGVARELAALLTKEGAHCRAGGDAAVLDAVSAGVRDADPEWNVQALLHDRGDLAADISDKVDVLAVVNSAPAHKLLMYENTDAIVALPGGVGTFDELWEVLTLIQCKKLDPRPVVLVGREFWQPIIDACVGAMFNDERKTIAPEDLDLFTIVDTPEQALAAVTAQGSRSAREASSAAPAA